MRTIKMIPFLILLLASASWAVPEPGAVHERARQFAPRAVHANAKRLARNKPIMAVNGRNSSAYSQAFETDTIEVLFNSGAHPQFGHALVRIGNRVYDYGNTNFLRNQRFTDAARYFNSPLYGFVFKTTPQKVAELRQAFDERYRNPPPFSSYGGAGKDSCATFVSSPLQALAPELGIRSTISATSLARACLSNANLEAVTMYGRATDEVGTEGFNFRKMLR